MELAPRVLRPLWEWVIWLQYYSAHGTASKVDLGGTFTLVASWDTVQSNSFSLGLAGGTPNDITLDTTPVPSYSQLNNGELGTYGCQLDFSFGLANTTTLYNTQDHPGTFGDRGDDGTALFQMFTIDKRNLDPFVPIHFDLFAETLRDPEKIVFAPFSHDATHAPEPASMLLFGTGLAGLGVFRRKFKKD